MYVIGITMISDFFISSQHQSTNALFFFSICPHDNYIYHKPQADLVSQKIGFDTNNLQQQIRYEEYIIAAWIMFTAVCVRE